MHIYGRGHDAPVEHIDDVCDARVNGDEVRGEGGDPIEHALALAERCVRGGVSPRQEWRGTRV
jgi:hypothetical protein